MASYHFSVQLVKRSEGRSAVAMAAYRAGEKLRDDRRGEEVDFQRRRGVVHAEIMAPDGAAEWLLDREKLWNGVERTETRCDAQLAREINMALPHELDADERLALVREFVREQFVSLGMVADFAIHAPVAEKDDDHRNFHAHVMLTMRQAGGGGLRRVKTREWNSGKLLARWRAAWADCQNAALRRRGMVQRVDHRTLAGQREEALGKGDRIVAAALDRLPEVHVGPKARGTQRVGKRPSAAPKRNVRLLNRTPRPAAAVSRADMNILVLRRNAAAFQRRIARTERRLVKLRLLLSRMETSRSVPVVRQHRWQARPVKLAAWEGPRLRRPTEHRYKRRDAVLRLISRLERLVSALLKVREDQLLRRTYWIRVMIGGEMVRMDLRFGRRRLRRLWPA